MKLTLIKQLNGSLIPAYDSDKKYTDKLKVGEPLTGNFTKPRNPEFHKKYFALLDLSYSNSLLSESLTFEDFRGEIIMRAGYYVSYRDFKGNLQYKPKSISFSNMDEIEFGELYNNSMDVILKYVLKDNTIEEIEENLINFM